jgi:hypothetical protein
VRREWALEKISAGGFQRHVTPSFGGGRGEALRYERVSK